MTSRPARVARATLTWGGAALAVSAVVPTLGQAFFLLSPPGTSWLYTLESPFFGTASAALLLIAYVLLAFGLRGEPGIVGASRSARAVFVVLALTTTLTAGYVPLPAITIGVSTPVLALAGVLLAVFAIVHVLALSVVAVVVFRAGVVGGLARWAFPALAVLTILVMVASRIPLPEAIGVWGAGLVAIPLVMLMTGALFLVHGLRSPRAIEAPAVSAG